MFKRIRKTFCKHNLVPVKGTEKHIGVTIDWSLKPTNEYEQIFKCLKCGIEIKQKYTYFMDYVPKQFKEGEWNGER